jgi:hypothetical protein
MSTHLLLQNIVGPDVAVLIAKLAFSDDLHKEIESHGVCGQCLKIIWGHRYSNYHSSYPGKKIYPHDGEYMCGGCIMYDDFQRGVEELMWL